MGLTYSTLAIYKVGMTGFRCSDGTSIGLCNADFHHGYVV
jgi:hypothetical protein